MAAFRTVWTALLSLYDATLVLLAANLATLVLNLPVIVIPFLVQAAFVLTGASAESWWVIATGAWLGLVPLLPTPANVALAGVTRIAAGPDVPHFGVFRATFGKLWPLALRMTVISVAILGALAWNVAFYLSVGPGWVQFIAILWLYAAVFWVALHVYLVPLMVHVNEPRLMDLYRRAAFVAIGHPGYTAVLLVLVLLLVSGAVVFLPIYVLVGLALISLIQAHALREVRRRHGDLLPEAEEEASRL